MMNPIRFGRAGEEKRRDVSKSQSPTQKWVIWQFAVNKNKINFFYFFRELILIASLQKLLPHHLISP